MVRMDQVWRTIEIGLRLLFGFGFWTFCGLVTLADAWPTCLGPLGATRIDCIVTTGILPSSGGPQILTYAAIGTLALIAFLPPPRRGWRTALVGAAAAGIAGSLVYLIVRSRTLDGFDRLGTWHQIPLPLDAWRGAWWATLAAGLGAVVAAHIVGPAVDAAKQRGPRP